MPKNKNVTIVSFSKEKHVLNPSENPSLFEGDKDNPVSVFDITQPYDAAVPGDKKQGDTDVRLTMSVQTTTYIWNKAAQKWNKNGQTQKNNFKSCRATMQTDDQVMVTHVSK